MAPNPDDPNTTTGDPWHQDDVRGFFHHPVGGSAAGALVLTHGAGANCRAPLLVAVANAFALRGYAVLRSDLPFRQRKASGPPHPAQAATDREGLRSAVQQLRKAVPGPVFLGGHSYGGRQASMLCAQEPELVSGLLLLSYPLHPPDKPLQLRTEHFPQLRTPSLFLHGTKDPFGTQNEMLEATSRIPAPTRLLSLPGAGHDLAKGKFDIVQALVVPFQQLMQDSIL